MDSSPGTPPSTGSVTTDAATFAFHPNILRCFICDKPPTNPISTSCGDVFCWPCMHQWLQNGPEPCPVCGYFLRRDLDIIPLFGAGDSTNTGIGTSEGTNTPNEATSDDINIDVIPARPRNPLLQSPATPMPIPTPVDNYSGSSNRTSANFVITPSSVLTALESSIQQLSESLDVERVRVMSLGIDCIDLELEVSVLEYQQQWLRNAVRERERVLGEERDEVVRSAFRVRALEERNARLACEADEGRTRERRFIERGNQMAELMARLQQRLSEEAD